MEMSRELNEKTPYPSDDEAPYSALNSAPYLAPSQPKKKPSFKVKAKCGGKSSGKQLKFPTKKTSSDRAGESKYKIPQILPFWHMIYADG